MEAQLGRQFVGADAGQVRSLQQAKVAGREIGYRLV